MFMEIALYVHNYQRRLCWMLSSLLQQRGEVPSFCVNVASLQGNGNPTTEDVVSFYRKQGLGIKHTIYTNLDDFEFRGLVRNKQLAETNAGWVLFGDCDLVVHPDFLASCFSELGALEDLGRCFYTGRYTTDLAEATALVDGLEYPCVIQDCWKQSNTLTLTRTSSIGAGFCQIGNVETIRQKHGGVFVDPAHCRDLSWRNRFWRTKSDKYFRRVLGKKSLPLPKFIHLQHCRDNQVGRHTEEQR